MCSFRCSSQRLYMCLSLYRRSMTGKLSPCWILISDLGESVTCPLMVTSSMFWNTFLCSATLIKRRNNDSDGPDTRPLCDFSFPSETIESFACAFHQVHLYLSICLLVFFSFFILLSAFRPLQSKT